MSGSTTFIPEVYILPCACAGGVWVRIFEERIRKMISKRVLYMYVLHVCLAVSVCVCYPGGKQARKRVMCVYVFVCESVVCASLI